VGGPAYEDVGCVDGTGNGFICMTGSERPSQGSYTGTAYCAQYATNGTYYMRVVLHEQPAWFPLRIAATGMGMWVSGSALSATDLTPLNAHQPNYGGGTSDACLHHLHLAANPLGMALEDADHHGATREALVMVEERALTIVPAEQVGTWLHVLVVDPSGRVLIHDRQQATSPLRFDLSAFAAGAYTMVLSGVDGERRAIRFVLP
jgi:hypothetical protein